MNINVTGNPTQTTLIANEHNKINAQKLSAGKCNYPIQLLPLLFQEYSFEIKHVLFIQDTEACRF